MRLLIKNCNLLRYNELADLIARASKSSLHELLSLLRSPTMGKKESHPLNIGVLRNLNKSETILLNLFFGKKKNYRINVSF